MTVFMNEIRPSDMRGFSRSVVELVTTLVNRHNVKYRPTTGGLMLYAPDGSRPFKISMKRPSGQTERYLLDWAGHNLRNHGIEEQVQHLAEKINDPVEHPRPAKIEPQIPEATPEPTQEQPVTADEWTPYMGIKGDIDTQWTTDGTRFKCTRCETEGREHIVDAANRIGGHNRALHPRDGTKPLRDPESTQKAVHAIAKTRTLRKTVNEVIDALAEVVGRDLTVTDPQRVQDLEAQVDTLTRERDEAVARLALIHEAMGV